MGGRTLQHRSELPHHRHNCTYQSSLVVCCRCRRVSARQTRHEKLTVDSYRRRSQLCLRHWWDLVGYARAPRTNRPIRNKDQQSEEVQGAKDAREAALVLVSILASERRRAGKEALYAPCLVEDRQLRIVPVEAPSPVHGELQSLVRRVLPLYRSCRLRRRRRQRLDRPRSSSDPPRSRLGRRRRLHQQRGFEQTIRQVALVAQVAKQHPVPSCQCAGTRVAVGDAMFQQTPE